MKAVPVLVLAVALLPAGVLGRVPADAPGSRSLAAWWRIREQIRDVSEFTAEGLMKWECFIGGPDDDDTNKDRHVIILIRRREGGESMTVAVTDLERSRNNPRIKFAAGTRTLVCGFAGGDACLIAADGGPAAWEATAAEILRAVIDKKRLLGEIPDRPPGGRV